MSKYAILLECDPGQTLGGSCLRDVKNLESHLIKRCNFKKENIVCLTTNNKYGLSAQSFFIELDDVKRKLCENDTLVILISGHGFQTLDTNGDEEDHNDEMINIGNRYVIDDEINAHIKDITSITGTYVVLLSDTCHSGTMFDLEYIYNDVSNTFKNRTSHTKHTIGNMLSLSACNDSQLSMCDVGDDTGFGGSLTTSVLSQGVLELLINDKKAIEAYKRIKTRLLSLNQTVLLSTN